MLERLRGIIRPRKALQPIDTSKEVDNTRVLYLNHSGGIPAGLNITTDEKVRLTELSYGEWISVVNKLLKRQRREEAVEGALKNLDETRPVSAGYRRRLDEVEYLKFLNGSIDPWSRKSESEQKYDWSRRNRVRLAFFNRPR